jgi:hypothetical protein
MQIIWPLNKRTFDDSFEQTSQCPPRASIELRPFFLPRRYPSIKTNGIAESATISSVPMANPGKVF